ncbi:MAG: hypothetical protein Q7S09_03245 [bacterium]|nr:hypothetical protein [bacterium]
MESHQLYLAQIFTVGNAIIDFFVTTDWTRAIFWIKIISFIISAVMLVGIVWVLKKHHGIFAAAYQKVINTKAAEPEIDPQVEYYEHEEWRNVVKLWSSHSLAEKRLALIDADALFDNVLRDRRIPGETFIERVASPEMPLLSNMNDVLFAHKFRNELVHETGATFDLIDAQTAFAAYEQALKELKII